MGSARDTIKQPVRQLFAAFIQNRFRVWDEFWFAERTAREMAIVRIVIATAATLIVLSWLNLSTWISDRGLLPASLNDYLVGRGLEGTAGYARWSPLNYSYVAYWTTAYVLITALSTFAVAIGLGGRWMICIAWLLMLGMVNRVSMIEGPAEMLITGIFGYLAIAPSRGMVTGQLRNVQSHWLNNFAIRLMQVHVGIWLVASLITHMADDMWWNGEGLWYATVASQAESPADWRSNVEFLYEHPFFRTLVGHAVVSSLIFLVLTWFNDRQRVLPVISLISLAGLVQAFTGDWAYMIALLSLIPLKLATLPREISIPSLKRSTSTGI